MSRFPLAAFATVLCFLAIPHGAAGQAAPTATAALEERITTLERTLRDLVTVLRRQSDGQMTDLLLRRVELAYLKRAPLDSERRDLRSKRAADYAEFQQLQTALAAHDALEDRTPVAADPESAIRPALFDSEVKRLKARLTEADLRLGELDSEIEQVDRNIRDWEARIEQRLERGGDSGR
ncbi:MAG: hypothetical protein SF066_08380 [Thermoanaerobaculia bacterium]|nr:hypothetical protein [Thermoanaerobaculia bacterium]